MKVEAAKKSQKKQAIIVKRKAEQKDSIGNNRTTALREEQEKAAVYRKEAARLRAEDQQDLRQIRDFAKQQQQFMILEKHINMQHKLEHKKQVVDGAGQSAHE